MIRDIFFEKYRNKCLYCSNNIRLSYLTKFISTRVLIFIMSCDVLDFTIKDIAKCIDRIHADTFVFTESVQQRFTDMVVFSQIILSDTFFFHGIPKLVIFNHNNNYLRACNNFILFL